MATYSIITTKEQDGMLLKLLVRANGGRGMLPPYTLATLVQRLMDDTFAGYISQDCADLAAMISDAYASASPSVQADVLAKLGIK